MIIFISGSINAGKTTTGKLLAQKLRAEFLDFDDISHTIPNFDLSKDIPKVFEKGIIKLNQLSEEGKDVIVSYVIRHKDYELLKRSLKAKTFFVTLAPPIKVAQTNRGRGLSEWERQRIDYHYRTNIANPTFGIIIDNSNLTLEETVDEIIQRLALNT